MIVSPPELEKTAFPAEVNVWVWLVISTLFVIANVKESPIVASKFEPTPPLIRISPPPKAVRSMFWPLTGFNLTSWPTAEVINPPDKTKSELALAKVISPVWS